MDSDTDFFDEGELAIEMLMDDVQDDPHNTPPQDIVDAHGNIIVDPHGTMPDDYEGRDVAAEVARDVAQADTRSIEQYNAAVAQVVNEAQEMAYLKAVFMRNRDWIDGKGHFLTHCLDQTPYNISPEERAQCEGERTRLALAWQQCTTEIQRIDQRAFSMHAAVEDAKVVAERPELATAAGQQRVIDGARVLLPQFGIDPDWFFYAWNTNPALRDHRSTLFFAGIFAAAVKPQRRRAHVENKMATVAENLADREARDEWAVDNIENILGAA